MSPLGMLSVIAIIVLVSFVGAMVCQNKDSLRRVELQNHDLEADLNALATVIVLQNAGPAKPARRPRHLRAVQGEDDAG